MMTRTTTIMAMAATITLLLSACGTDESADTSETASANAVLISIQQAKTIDLPIWLQTVGHIQSRSVPTLAAEVEGRITLVTADTGEVVEAGQLLAETDTSNLQLQQQAAQASLERLDVHIANGQRRVERFQSLSAKKLSSQTELDDATEQLQAYRADHKAAVAKIALVEDSLTKSRIVAPVSGVIQQRYISTGDFVKRGEALFDITQPENLQAWLSFPERLALKIEVGQSVKIYSPLTARELNTGEVTQLQPSIGLGSRAVMAIVDLQEPGNLRPRATLSGSVLVETRQNAVMIPVISVVRRPAGESVYIIRNDKATARLVETGHRQGGLVEITAGLEGGEIVATDGAAFLTDGASVRISESDS
jgi:RND family efflux transporter MFP subunit